MTDNVPGSTSPSASEQSGKKSRTDGQSAKMTLPDSVRSEGTAQLSDDSRSQANPFTMPADNDIFLMRDKERQKKKQERIKQRNLKVHEKTTYATRVNTKTASMIQSQDRDSGDAQSDEDDAKAMAVKDDPQFTLAVTRDRHVEKESLADYINKKREMFLVQYSLGVKRDEMRKLEEIAAAEEKKLEMAEQYLEEDAAMFDEFLKENDKNSVEAIKIAEAETKAKLEKVSDIKRINAQMMAIKSEISNYEDMLKEYQHYKRFLETLTPKEWLEERSQTTMIRREAKIKAAEQKYKDTETVTSSERSAGQGKRKPTKSGPPARTASVIKGKSPGPAERGDSVLSLTDSDEDSDEDLELYFTEPQQLLNIFAELEEQNLSLIQNSQETEEALEEMKQSINSTKSLMEKETEILKDQIKKLETSIKREEEKAKELATKARLFSYGEFKQEDQEKMLAALNGKVEAVYRSCIGDNEANISTLQMLTNIENRLEELFEQIEMMPPEKVEAAEKSKEKERRLKLREEKMEEQRLHQEERVKRALERANAEPKKTTGRRVVARSEPPRLKKAEDDGADQASREEEELAYFFTP